MAPPNWNRATDWYAIYHFHSYSDIRSLVAWFFEVVVCMPL